MSSTFTQKWVCMLGVCVILGICARFFSFWCCFIIHFVYVYVVSLVEFGYNTWWNTSNKWVRKLFVIFTLTYLTEFVRSVFNVWVFTKKHIRFFNVKARVILYNTSPSIIPQLTKYGDRCSRRDKSLWTTRYQVIIFASYGFKVNSKYSCI